MELEYKIQLINDLIEEDESVSIKDYLELIKQLENIELSTSKYTYIKDINHFVEK